MFTRNYWLYQAANFVNKSNEVMGKTENDGKPKLITVSGAVAGNTYNTTYNYRDVSFGLIHAVKQVSTFDVSQNSGDDTNSIVSKSNGGVYFGSGNTPATIDDYKLSGDVIQNITTSYVENSIYEEDGSAGTLSYTYTITNNNDTEITIGEVALFGEAYWQTASSSNSATYTHFFYLFERTALESPVTIPAGGVGQVTYTIRMNYPVG